MRIPFYKTTSSTETKLIDITRQYDVVQQTYPSLAMSFDNLEINDVQSYTDDARYHLDIFEVDVDRCYNRQSIANQFPELMKHAKLQVFAIQFNFNMDVNFKLFQDNWTDYWKTDIVDANIYDIKPLVEHYGTIDLGYHVFKSLFTSYIVKMLALIDTNHVMCVKHNDMLIFAYAIENHATYAARNDILDLFLDGVYNMVKVTSGRGHFELPSNKYYNEIDVMQEYDSRRERAELANQKRSFTFYKN